MFPILHQSPTYVTSCNGKGEAKAAHPCFERWGSTIGFWLGDYKTTWTAVLTRHDPFGLPSAFRMPLSRRLKQEKLHQQEPQLVQCVQQVS